jgi:putative ABC transport system permease protein
MRFIFSMGFRETRSAWKRLLFFFVCIAIGVGAIVAMRSLLQSVRQVLGGEARTLLAADVMISTGRPWSDGVETVMARRLAEQGVRGRTDAIEMPTMVMPAAGGREIAKIVELRAVEPGFPFYGTITLQNGRPYDHALLRGHGALVGPELLAQIDVSVGSRIVIGRQTFTITGVIVREAGRQPGAFSLGPRVLIDRGDLEQTGLLAFGSRARRQILLKVDDAVMPTLVSELRADLKGQSITVRSYRQTENRIGDNLARAENYLSLVGLVIVVLGGISVSSVMRVFVQQKIKTIAIVKCVGASTRQILSIYLLQALTLGLAGSVLGVGLASLALGAVPSALVQYAGVPVALGLTASAVIQGIGIGVLVALLFALVPLLEVRHVRPALLLRHDTKRAGTDWVRLATIGLVGAALVALTSWQAASLEIGLAVSAGFVGVALILHLVGYALTLVTAPLARVRAFPLRQAVLRLSRPGNQTRMILLAVGLGSFFIIGVRSLQASLLEEFTLQVGDNAPDMFLIDIQRDQASEVSSFLASRIPDLHGEGPTLIPVLRARVTALRGPDRSFDNVEDERGRGSLGREYTVTYRAHLMPNERLLAGRFFDDPGRGPGRAEPEVSIEKSIRDRFGVRVGELLQFDVLGRTIQARVTSVRDVQWEDSRTGGFMFVFSPGVFEQAPHSYFSPVRGVPDPTTRALLQHDLVVKFPNISVIDVRAVLDTVRSVMDTATLAITIVGVLVLASGVLILIGAVAMTKFQRVYEAAIFKTLGASARDIAAMLVIEYGLLGLLAGTVGSLGAIGLTWGVSQWALDIPWRFAPRETVGGLLVTTVLVAVVGVVASLDVLRRKPLATLRAE